MLSIAAVSEIMTIGGSLTRSWSLSELSTSLQGPERFLLARLEKAGAAPRWTLIGGFESNARCIMKQFTVDANE